MNPSAMTAAHRSLPFGTKLKVTNTNNGKAVVVRINDRGPFIRGRVLDLLQGGRAPARLRQFRTHRRVHGARLEFQEEVETGCPFATAAQQRLGRAVSPPQSLE